MAGLLKQTKIVFVVSILSMVFLLMSCGGVGYYNPDPSIAKDTVQIVSDTPGNSAKISIINAQPSKKEHELNFQDIIVNYHDFTQSLVVAMKAELANNHIIVTDSAQKILKVEVDKVAMFYDAVNFRSYIRAKVHFNDGNYKKFTASRATYASPLMQGSFPTKPLNAAFTDLVGKIINDHDVMTYINE